MEDLYYLYPEPYIKVDYIPIYCLLRSITVLLSFFFFRCVGLWTSISSIASKPVRHAESQTSWVNICILRRSPGDSKPLLSAVFNTVISYSQITVNPVGSYTACAVFLWVELETHRPANKAGWIEQEKKGEAGHADTPHLR